MAINEIRFLKKENKEEVIRTFSSLFMFAIPLQKKRPYFGFEKFQNKDDLYNCNNFTFIMY